MTDAKRRTLKKQPQRSTKPARGSRNPVSPFLRSKPQDPSSKLDRLRAMLAAEAGATPAELARALKWQAHTIRAAISRLRARGHHVVLTEIDDRRVYKLTPAASKERA